MPSRCARRGRFCGSGGASRSTAASAELVARIAQRLHEDFFSTGTPRPRRGGPATAPDDGGEFVRALSQANGGRGAWQDGWRIAAVEAGEAAEDDGADEADEALVVVRPDGLALVAPTAAVRAAGDVVAGAAAAVLQPKELRGLSPGFYIGLGDAGRPAGEDCVGLFWNVTAAGAVTLTARLTYALNGAGLPFALELLDTPARYGRGDAAVLRLARADFARRARAGQAAAAHARRAPDRGRAGVHAAAGSRPRGRRAARGRAALRRASLPAAGRGGRRGGRPAPARTGSPPCATRFAAAGLSLDTPYLQPGSADAYDRS